MTLKEMIHLVGVGTVFSFDWHGSEEILLCEDTYRLSDEQKIPSEILNRNVAEVNIYECDDTCECETRKYTGGQKGNMILYLELEYNEDELPPAQVGKVHIELSDAVEKLRNAGSCSTKLESIVLTIAEYGVDILSPSDIAKIYAEIKNPELDGIDLLDYEEDDLI
jgi:hypothetical protein